MGIFGPRTGADSTLKNPVFHAFQRLPQAGVFFGKVLKTVALTTT